MTSPGLLIVDSSGTQAFSQPSKQSTMIEKPLVTVSGRKVLFNSSLHRRIVNDLPSEGVDWRRRLDSNSKSVYIDVDFVDFDIDDVERSSERLSRLAVGADVKTLNSDPTNQEEHSTNHDTENSILDSVQMNIDEEPSITIDQVEDDTQCKDKSYQNITDLHKQQQDISQAFFNRKLLGRPILHTYWADKTDFEADNQKGQFDDWIGKVQASNCTEWAIIIIEDGDFKAQVGTAIFKSKLQSSASQSNVSTSSISSTTHTSASFMDRVKKGLSTMFQNDSNSDRWLTLINQERQPDNKTQESYDNFLRKLRNIIMASFSKQIELFEEHLRVRRELRNDKSWNFFTHFSMQEELAFAFEFLTLFDEALVQYDLLDALYSEYITSASFNNQEDPHYEQWTSFKTWEGLCLDLSNEHSDRLRRKIVERKASLLDLRNYLFAKQCDLMLLQNQPWRVAASASIFLQNCIREHEYLGIETPPGALICWSFVSALEVLQKCECYSCTSTMENYSLHTVDIWNCARKQLLKLGQLTSRMPDSEPNPESAELTQKLLAGLGIDPHKGVSYQNDQISPQARLKDALTSKDRFSKHLIDISELTLGTYKHIGRKRHAFLLGKEIADFYMSQQKPNRALPFLVDFEKNLIAEQWYPLLNDVQKLIVVCKKMISDKSNSRESPKDDLWDKTTDIQVTI